MLDNKKVGIKIAILRKGRGYSQEKLADMLCISPQAISKWENGHTFPETSLLPVLAQIFGCSIDDIIMPAYTIDQNIEEQKNILLDNQVEQITQQVIKKIGDNIVVKNMVELSDETILDAVHKVNPNVGVCTMNRGNSNKVDGDTITNITVSAAQKQFDLIEKRYGQNDNELYRYDFISRYLRCIPQVYQIDFEKKIVLKEDLSETHIQCFNYDESNEFGTVIRENYHKILRAAAKWHADFWENSDAFSQIGLDWRLESKESLLAHISGMEKDFKKYKKNEESGEIPKVWSIYENHIDLEKLECFETAIQILKDEYVKLIETRFHIGKNITIIHGDMHPGRVNMSKTDKTVKFDGLGAVRMGLCTEDLAMLLALHIEPDKEKVLPLLDDYYNCLCETVKDYPYEMFMNDYKISIMENMFFTVRLINRGIFDFTMRDKAIRAFETFVL